MIVRLHNLSARAPVMTDLKAVAELRHLCDDGGEENIPALENTMRQCWQKPGFLLQMDAWAIVTNQGRIVGYADVQRKNERIENEFLLCLHVHPSYRDRGLATLLIWLAEERARQFTRRIPVDVDVVLSSSVSSMNEWARSVYIREGYTLARRFWRLTIGVEEAVARSSAEPSRLGQLTVDVVLDTDAEIESDQEQNAACYVARQYEVYTKVLRMSRKGEMEKVLITHPCGV